MQREGKTAGARQPERARAAADAFATESVRPSQHLIAYEWAPTSSAAGERAQAQGSARIELLLRPWPLLPGMTDLPLRRFPIEPGMPILFRVHERWRLCIGYRERTTLKRLPCSQHGEELGSIERGPDYARVFQCSTCAELEGVPEWLRHEAMPRWVGLETPSPEALEQAPYLSEPHIVYLAAFGPGRVKVGVAIERRARLRFLEQGAHLGAIIARCPDGFAARRMERALCDLGLIDRVRAASKIRGLYPLLADGEAREEIDKTFSYVTRHLTTEEVTYLLPTPEVEDFRPAFCLQAVHAQPERLFPTVDVPIHGRVLATAGSCIVMERDGGRLCAVDMAGLRGALLSIARFQGGVIAQMDLFGDFLGEQAG